MLYFLFNCEQQQITIMAKQLIQNQVKRILSNYLYDNPLKEFAQQVKAKQYHNPYRNINKPLDRFLRSYFTKNKYLGPSERHSIGEKVYNYARYEYLLSHLIRSRPYDPQRNQKYTRNIEKEIQYKINNINTSQFYAAIDNTKLPKYLRCSQNKILFKELSLSYMEEDILMSSNIIRDRKKIYQLGDEDKAFDISQIMNSRAPLTIRVNPLKITKSKLVEKLELQLKQRLQKCEFVPFGFKIVAPKSINLLELEQFRNGQFEIQDEGSQIVASQIKCKPGDLILDYCGGSGGKSLAIAHQLSGKGQIFVHDPRQYVLQKAKKRFSRAGINNVQFHSNQQNLSKICLGKIDWIILDVPCTGIGTLRRNPDIKLKFNQEMIQRQVTLQRQIFAKAMRFLGKGKNSRIVYMTCSLLKQQNEEQISYFMASHNLELDNNEYLRIDPRKDGNDGFFAAVLKRK